MLTALVSNFHHGAGEGCGHPSVAVPNADATIWCTISLQSPTLQPEGAMQQLVKMPDPPMLACRCAAGADLPFYIKTSDHVDG